MLIAVATLLFSATASAYDFEVDGFYYNIISLSDLTVEVTAGDNKYSGKLIIPSTVTYKSKTLTVTSIGGYAFDGCSGLTSITIPNSVTSIGDDTFSGCSGLTSIEIPNSVTSIGDDAFRSCSGLTSIEIPNSVTSIGEYAFWACSGLTSIEIPNSVTSIGEYAFWACSGLTSITIPNSVTSIGNGAFQFCSGLTSVTIPNSVTSIGRWAFSDCNSLKELRIEDGTETLSLGYSYYNQNYNGLGRGLFYDCPLEALYLGRNLSYNTDKSYGYSPFYNNKTLTSVTIGNTVTNIGSYTFSECSGLTSVTIPNSVTSIGNNAFNGCNKLEKIYLNTATVGRWFAGKTSIKEIMLGSDVTSIKNSAFYGCSGLTSIHLKGAIPPTVKNSIFTNSHFINTTVYIPKGSLETYQSTDVWKDFWDIQEYDATGIDDINANNIAIKMTANGILLPDAKGKNISIYSTNGALIKEIITYTGEEISLTKNGIYIINIDNITTKVKL